MFVVLYDEENHGARKFSYYYYYTTIGRMNKTIGPGNFNITTTIVILYDEQNPPGQEISILLLL